jgi:hypothetical protein
VIVIAADEFIAYTATDPVQKEPNKGRQKTKNEKRKTNRGMNKSASLTPVQGPSTAVCMLVTKLSQLPH